MVQDRHCPGVVVHVAKVVVIVPDDSDEAVRGLFAAVVVVDTVVGEAVSVFVAMVVVAEVADTGHVVVVVDVVEGLVVPIVPLEGYVVVVVASSYLRMEGCHVMC